MFRLGGTLKVIHGFLAFVFITAMSYSEHANSEEKAGKGAHAEYANPNQEKADEGRRPVGDLPLIGKVDIVITDLESKKEYRASDSEDRDWLKNNLPKHQLLKISNFFGNTVEAVTKQKLNKIEVIDELKLVYPEIKGDSVTLKDLKDLLLSEVEAKQFDVELVATGKKDSNGRFMITNSHGLSECIRLTVYLKPVGSNENPIKAGVLNDTVSRSEYADFVDMSNELAFMLRNALIELRRDQLIEKKKEIANKELEAAKDKFDNLFNDKK